MAGASLLLNTKSPCWRALRLARALPAPVRGPRALAAVIPVGRHLFGRRHCSSPSGPASDGAVSLNSGIDKFVRDPAQALTQTLALEIELREHVVAPGDRNTE
jgi:hypothetical protein